MYSAWSLQQESSHGNWAPLQLYMTGKQDFYTRGNALTDPAPGQQFGRRFLRRGLFDFLRRLIPFVHFYVDGQRSCGHSKAAREGELDKTTPKLFVIFIFRVRSLLLAVCL